VILTLAFRELDTRQALEFQLGWEGGPDVVTELQSGDLVYWWWLEAPTDGYHHPIPSHQPLPMHSEQCTCREGTVGIGIEHNTMQWIRLAMSF
jgi:hypothetical protein